MLLAALALPLLAENTSFWYDEAYTVEVADRGARDLALVIRDTQAAYSSGYYALVHVVGRRLGLGFDEQVLRGMSLVAMLVMVVGVHAIGRRAFDGRVAGIGALLVAANGFILSYSVEARMYAIVLALVTIATYDLLSLLQRERGFVLYVATGGFAALCHWLAGFVLLSHVVAAALLWRLGLIHSRALLRVGAVAATAILPAAVVFAAATLVGDDFRGLDWIPPLSLPRVLQVIQVISGTRSSVLLVALVVLGVLSVRYRRDTDGFGGESDPRIGKVVLAAWFLVPIVLAISLSAVRPMLVDRYLIVVVPAAAILVAAGVATFGRAAPVIACVVIVAFLLARFPRQLREDWRPAVSALAVRAERDDGVLIYGLNGRTPFRYYAQRVEPQLVEQLIDVPYASVIEESALSASVSDLDRVWVVRNGGGGDFSPAGDAAIVTRLTTLGFRSSEQVRFVGVELELFDRTTA